MATAGGGTNRRWISSGAPFPSIALFLSSIFVDEEIIIIVSSAFVCSITPPTLVIIVSAIIEYDDPHRESNLANCRLPALSDTMLRISNLLPALWHLLLLHLHLRFGVRRDAKVW